MTAKRPREDPETTSHVCTLRNLFARMVSPRAFLWCNGQMGGSKNLLGKPRPGNDPGSACLLLLLPFLPVVLAFPHCGENEEEEEEEKQAEGSVAAPAVAAPVVSSPAFAAVVSAATAAARAVCASAAVAAAAVAFVPASAPAVAFAARLSLFRFVTLSLPLPLRYPSSPPSSLAPSPPSPCCCCCGPRSLCLPRSLCC